VIDWTAKRPRSRWGRILRIEVQDKVSLP